MKTVLQGIMGKDDIEDGHNVPELVRLIGSIHSDFKWVFKPLYVRSLEKLFPQYNMV